MNKLIDRYDIYNNLPHGAMKFISDKLGCSKTQVKHVLEGERTDNQGIIKEAELIAAKYIWIERFCKRKKSKLNLFE